MKSEDSGLNAKMHVSTCLCSVCGDGLLVILLELQTGLARGAYVCLYFNKPVTPRVIIVSTFSPFLCHLMDLFAAYFQVKIKKATQLLIPLLN